MTKGSEKLRQNKIRQRIAAGEFRNLPVRGGSARRPRSSINPNNGRTMGSSNRGGAQEDARDLMDVSLNPPCKGHFYYLPSNATQHCDSNIGGSQCGAGDFEDADPSCKGAFPISLEILLNIMIQP